MTVHSPRKAPCPQSVRSRPWFHRWWADCDQGSALVAGPRGRDLHLPLHPSGLRFHEEADRHRRTPVPPGSVGIVASSTDPPESSQSDGLTVSVVGTNTAAAAPLAVGTRIGPAASSASAAGPGAPAPDSAAGRRAQDRAGPAGADRAQGREKRAPIDRRPFAFGYFVHPVPQCVCEMRPCLGWHPMGRGLISSSHSADAQDAAPRSVARSVTSRSGGRSATTSAGKAARHPGTNDSARERAMLRCRTPRSPPAML